MVQTTEAKQDCRAASTVLFPALEFGVKPCGEYTRENFREILSQIAFEQEFANTGGKPLQLDRDELIDITAAAREHNSHEDTKGRERHVAPGPNPDSFITSLS